MSVTFDTAPKSPTANSYCTVEQADDFLLSQRAYADAWSALGATQKQAFLMWATFLLDSVMVWAGVPRTLSQRLRWPRVGADRPDNNGQYDYETVPDVVARGTAEFALALARRDRTAEPEVLGLGLGQIGVGRTRLVVDKTQVLGLIPENVMAVLSPVGWPDTNGGSSGAVRLVRS
jgi:hypothetical protein